MEKKKINVSAIQVVEQYWKALKPNKGYFFLAVTLFIIAVVIGVFTPLYYKKFFDVINGSTDKISTAITLTKIVFSILIIRLSNWLFWRAGQFIWSTTMAKVMARLRQNSFDYLVKHSYTFFANRFTGSLVQKLGRFVRSFESLADTMVYNFIPLIITIIGSLWITWSVAPVLSIILSIWVLVITAFNILFSKWQLKYNVISAEADSKASGYLADSLTNNTAISFFTGHKHEALGFKEVTNDQARKTLFSWRLGDISDLVQTLLIVLVEFFVFYYAIKYWQLGRITIGTFVLAQTYIIGLTNQLWGLSRIIRTFYQSLADAKEMVDLLIMPYEIKDEPNAKELVVDKGEILFNNVSFDFGDDNKVLKGVTTTIKAGEKVAIIGHSGAGKTTFVRLIMRLYDVTKGHISIDGQDISKVTQDSLRHNVSFVPQDPILFHRTLMDNIRYGKREASDEEVINAAKLAHCDEFIYKLPLKYETFVGERGIKLSGGERQRIAIARAILKRAPILVFDEATSSLDSYSESLIQDALETLMKDCTTIVIAHRLSTVKKMDRIIAMEDGSIVEDGTHDELSNKEGGLYKKLWDLQVGGFL